MIGEDASHVPGAGKQRRARPNAAVVRYQSADA
jgi:hypothetical protein